MDQSKNLLFDKELKGLVKDEFYHLSSILQMLPFVVKNYFFTTCFFSPHEKIWDSLKLKVIVDGIEYGSKIEYFLKDRKHCRKSRICWLLVPQKLQDWFFMVFNSLALYDTIPTFNNPKNEGFGKQCGKRRKCW